MNRWAECLSAVPPTLHRLIARSQRISLPRGCPPSERIRRVRQAICRPTAVRATYFALSPEAQAALQQLRAEPRGRSPAELTARYGPLRPWSVIADDRAPQSLSEQLVLLGWLLPRPATPRHPTRFLLPPELRAALPRPLALPDRGSAPPPPPPPSVRAAVTILLACAEQPLPLCAAGSFVLASLRRLLPRLTPLDAPAATALCQFVLPLLIDLGLLAPHGTAAALAPAGARFLALPPQVQSDQLCAAWLRAPRADAWLRPLLVSTRGIDWPLFRRRLLLWAAALPAGRRLDPSRLFAALVAALGPLADAQTHGLRTVDRAPWQPKRAAAIWDAALRGPLTWLGAIAWCDDAPSAPPQCYATGRSHAAITIADADTATGATAHADADAASAPPLAWCYGTLGELQLPHAALDADVLGLLPYARWQATDATSTTYHINARSLAAALRDGQAASVLAALLTRRAGALPADWSALLEQPRATVRVLHTTVVLSDEPTVLAHASQARSVRRYLTTRLAPGIALVEPSQAAALVRALERQSLAVEVQGDPAVAPPEQAFSPHERALLLASCAAYRAQASDAVPLAALAALEQRLRVGLPAALLPAAPPPTSATAAPAATVASPSTALPDDAAPLSVASRSLPVPSPAASARSVASVGVSAAVLCGLLWTLLLVVLRRASPAEATKDDGRWTMDGMADLGRSSFVVRPAQATKDEGRWTNEGMADLGRSSAVVRPMVQANRVALATALPLLRQAIAQRRLVRIAYTSAPASGPTERIIRPLRLESHGDIWYLHAYCTLAQAERLFRLDRISELALLDARTRARPAAKPGPRPRPADARIPAARARAPVAAPRSGFFPAPPSPPPNTPLVRIWLEE
jgi:hypothetical protein